MRSVMRSAILAGTVAVAAGCAAQENPPIDMAAEEQAIRQVEQQLLTAAQAKDAGSFAALFAADAQLLFPNRPKAIGREAVQATVAEDFALPGFHITWEPSSILIAQSADLAVSVGSYHLTLALPDAPMEDRGKYMTVWRKVDGQWRVAADMINTDTPLPTP